MISGRLAGLIVCWFVAGIWALVTNSDPAWVVVFALTLSICSWALMLATVLKVVPGSLGLIDSIEHPTLFGVTVAVYIFCALVSLIGLAVFGPRLL